MVHFVGGILISIVKVLCFFFCSMQYIQQHQFSQFQTQKKVCDSFLCLLKWKGVWTIHLDFFFAFLQFTMVAQYKWMLVSSFKVLLSQIYKVGAVICFTFVFGYIVMSQFFSVCLANVSTLLKLSEKCLRGSCVWWPCNICPCNTLDQAFWRSNF